MTQEMSKDSMLTFGWFHYTRGRASGIHKNHFLLQGTWKTVCGCHTVSIPDRANIRFVNESDLFKNKRCKVCMNILARQTRFDLR
ncbi:MAG: hypothetical protein HY222_03205 [Thaumarchaeota archaeon]|nr:hypothetical protein [Nitrososphaerota archaeon]